MGRDTSGANTSHLDAELVEALVARDEGAFKSVVKRYNSAMVRLALAFVPNRAVAEEVTQEAWLAMVQGISGFKGHSSLKTWLFGILLNRAKSSGLRERRSIDLSSFESVGSPGPDGEGGDPNGPHESASERLTPVWGRSGVEVSPEDLALSGELRLSIEKAIGDLPPAQRAVIVLRDVEGWSSREVCELLGISPENQRVRLHRARLRVRKAIKLYLKRR